MSLYNLEFDPRAISEARRLPMSSRRELRECLEFLRAAPHRSHPGVSVKELREVRGVWRFHLSARGRVFYSAEDGRLIVLMIDSSPGVNSATVKELRRRLRG